jgi:hypothetical protein
MLKTFFPSYIYIYKHLITILINKKLLLSILKIDIILKIHLITFLELFGLVVIKKNDQKAAFITPDINPSY